MLDAIHGHWGIENSLHWVLDVAFREDECRLRTGHAAHTTAALRRVTHTLLRRNTNTNSGIANKRRLAGWDLAYMEEILGMWRLCVSPRRELGKKRFNPFLIRASIATG